MLFQAFGHRKGVAGTERATAFENATTFGDTQAAPSLPTAAEPEQEKDEEDKPDPVAIARQKQEELQQELDQVAEQCASLEENLIIMAQTRTQLQGQVCWQIDASCVMLGSNLELHATVG